MAKHDTDPVLRQLIRAVNESDADDDKGPFARLLSSLWRLEHRRHLVELLRRGARADRWLDAVGQGSADEPIAPAVFWSARLVEHW